MTVLEVEGISVQYGAVIAVRDVSITLTENEAVAIVGPNGAGKSSLLQAIANVVPLSTGECRVLGRSTKGVRPEVLSSQGLALVPERRRIFGTLSVRENLELGGAAFGLSASARRRTASSVATVLEHFPELAHHLDKPGQTLSGGQQQMLAIGRALVGNPRILLLDEPSLGLAPVVVDRVFELLRDLREAGPISVLLVEQNAIRAIEYADRAMILRSGSVVIAGHRDELLARENLANDFLGHGSLEGS